MSSAVASSGTFQKTLVRPEAFRAEGTRGRDDLWVKRARDGDDEAFRQLVLEYEQRAYRIAFGVLGHPEEARDVAQEAFLRVYRSLDRFRAGQSFYTWFYRIVVNLSIDHLRRRPEGVRVAFDELGDAVGVECSPEKAMDRREVGRLVRATLAKLPPKYRVVLVLRDIEDLGAREIARIAGCTHATARWRLHKARRLFREMWERRHPGSGESRRLAGARDSLEEGAGSR